MPSVRRLLSRVAPALALTTALCIAAAPASPGPSAGLPHLTSAHLIVQWPADFWPLGTAHADLAGRPLASVMAALRGVWRTPRPLTCQADVDAMGRAGWATLYHLYPSPTPAVPGTPTGIMPPLRLFAATAVPACHLVFLVNDPTVVPSAPGFRDPHNAFFHALMRAACQTLPAHSGASPGRRRVC